MLKYPLFPAVASSQRRKILPPLAAIALFGSMMLLATGLLALGSFTPTASAEPYCDRPDPPPICDGDPDEPEEPPAPPEEKLLSLTATSQHGTVAIHQGEPAETRIAWSDQPFYLRGTLTGVSPARSANLRVTETWRCAPGWEWADGTFTTTAVGTHTVADPSSRCPNGALYWDAVTAFAYDPQGHLLPTGELTIWVYGNHWPDDLPPGFGPW
jgi:hypothetical protein